MKNVNLSRCALSVCAAGALLVGCGGPQAQSWNAASPLQSSAKPSREVLKQAAGGAFTATYTGTAKSGSGCDGGLICITHFHGTGSGTFIGRSSLTGEIICSEPSHNSGDFTFRSEKHRADAFTVSFGQSICSLERKKPYTVYSGEGKFANASGDGTLHLVSKSSNHTFTASWKGTLKF